MYTATDDPSDGYSNHWSNGEHQEYNEECCTECGREGVLMEGYYYCNACKWAFNEFEDE
jgi:ribosomal protein L37AE/L43A